MDNFRFETEKDLIARDVLSKDQTFFAQKRFIPKRLLLQWHVTERCNLRCRHCYQANETDSELSLDEEKNVVDQVVKIVSDWGVRGHINFTGGEPFIKKSFPDLIRKVFEHRKILGFAVLTNGSLIDDSLARELKRLRCRFVQVSLDGDPHVHDNDRGANNFQRTLESIKLLKRRRLRVLVSFTAHSGNIDTFEHVAEACRKLNVDLVWSDRLLPYGRGINMKDQVLDPCDLEVFFEKMYQIRRSYSNKWFNRTTVGMHRALQFLVLNRHGGKNVIPYTCHAGRSLMTILASGEIVPCRRMPVVVGDLRSQSFEDIYYSSLLLKRLRNRKHISEGCEMCEYAQQCNGGLRCMSYAYYGTPFKADPQCFKLYRRLPVLNKEEETYVKRECCCTH